MRKFHIEWNKKVQLVPLIFCRGFHRYARLKSQEKEPFTKDECWQSHVRFGLDRRHLHFCQQPQTSNAVVYAMSSGALLYEIARRCAMDKITNCKCGRHDWATELDPEMQQDQALVNPYEAADEFIWNGCADNVEMAHTYAKIFLAYDRMKDGSLVRRRRRRQMNRRNNQQQYPFYARQRRRVPRQAFGLNNNFRYARQTAERNVSEMEPDGVRKMMPMSQGQRLLKTLRMLNGHNYEAGLKIMEKNRKYTCKCHGVSGSCSQKVCFRQLQRLDSTDIQNAFRQHYLLNPVGTGLMAREFRYGLYMTVPVEDSDLVYTEHSPDYCEVDVEKGSFGTYGR
ncbi:Protein Wnt-11 [Cichlidogyrus casuarinus]|uniref:Protein Wnt n=1 Tax=Cichlidogyrus casuarinus TaxID=1844966 RepID=A0ABD2QHZ6_9PLAT